MTAVPSYVRARGEIRASFLRAGERTMIGNLHETGGLRLRFPTSAPGCEAVIVNTGGGVAGGDRQSVDVHAEVGAHAAQFDFGPIAFERGSEAGRHRGRSQVAQLLGRAHLTLENARHARCRKQDAGLAPHLGGEGEVGL